MDHQLHHDARASIGGASSFDATAALITAFRLHTRWRMRICVRQSAEQ
ncbi:hypothetical protein [Azospirillum rugosum]|uniref:Uncharacterized protein n=1 Tax=Azospirillum rugosum TaxID=416170 RepID=A0ABS4SDI2_9PROT|nr:hypothetical protein [Azospirillum rugosum]MBP2290643.1 hypothetical protein [Azospirillum rugosum]MDQ0525531.1 hypothetical protein [Azospirillum rugosum]